ncbi:conserved protein of unknown function [Petrocella atlantisensis]|uniref:Uncharacterized protein n=1 Tax=Petrocella atlantisensis TaxID=2173034 RepID=A0A3P7P1T7_9FIRM|nr:hypothetical protein [Petrocella atlantisensis]VDN47450.1 conserved protein of unknown function [Petrocella atlantisensis]
MERQEPLDFETFLIQKERRRRNLRLQTDEKMPKKIKKPSRQVVKNVKYEDYDFDEYDYEYEE